MPKLVSRILLVVFLMLAFIAGRHSRSWFPSYDKTIRQNYLNNYKFTEQTDYYSIYHKKATIVMLGNSFIESVHWDELLGRDDVVNRGIGIDITNGYLHRLKSVISCSPKICFIEGGANDLAFKIPMGSIIDNLSAIADTLKKYKIVPVLMSVSHVTANYPDATNLNNRITSLNKRLRQTGYEYIDIDSALSKEDTLLIQYARDDGQHLNSRAYIVWRDKIKDVLNKYHI